MRALLGAASAVVLPSAMAQGTEVLLPETSVTARADAQELRRQASAATIVFGREDLEAMDADSVGELLRKLPGTGLFADLEGGAGKRGRGKGPDRHMPQILVDGQPLPGGDKSPATALRLPVELIERIEIIRNGTAEFPSSGPGGTINLVLRDVPPSASAGLRAGLGSLDGRTVTRFEGLRGDRNEDFGWLVAGAYGSRPSVGRRDGDIQRFTAGARSAWTTEAVTERGRDHHLSLTPRLTRTLAPGQQLVLSPMLNLTEDDRESLTRKMAYADPAAGTGLAASGEDAERDRSRRAGGRLGVEWRHARPGVADLSLRLMLQAERENKERDRREYNAAGALAATRAETERRDEREAGLMFKGKWPVGEAHLLTLGAEAKRKTGTDEKTVVANGVLQAAGADASQRQAENRHVLWAQDEWQLTDNHVLTPGLRWQALGGRITDGLGVTSNRSHSSIDPSLHGLWQATPAWNLRASVARSEKAPGIKDLSGVVRTATGVNASSNPDKGGNPQLAPERSLSFEAGVEHFLPARAGNAGLSFYRRRIDNQVQKLTRLEGGRWIERPYNVGNAELTGFVADLKARLDGLGLPALTLRGNLAVSRTRIVDPVATLGAGEGPRRSANLGFDYEFGEPRITVGGNFNWADALDRENSATLRQVQAARRQLDLYALWKLDRQTGIRVSAQNLTRARRDADLTERDAAGLVSRLETDRESSVPSLMVTLEAKW
ncbi:MAG: TonB-dependent receptor [Sterolibacteriaceae bacterium MAG5]|nr:TonB-dependent receptor [Candidatus Nitricoxidireducens bremensis]